MMHLSYVKTRIVLDCLGKFLGRLVSNKKSNVSVSDMKVSFTSHSGLPLPTGLGREAWFPEHLQAVLFGAFLNVYSANAASPHSTAR